MDIFDLHQYKEIDFDGNDYRVSLVYSRGYTPPPTVFSKYYEYQIPYWVVQISSKATPLQVIRSLDFDNYAKARRYAETQANQYNCTSKQTHETGTEWGKYVIQTRLPALVEFARKHPSHAIVKTLIAKMEGVLNGSKSDT